jgi:hypothetical protein
VMLIYIYIYIYKHPNRTYQIKLTDTKIDHLEDQNHCQFRLSIIEIQ